jgi:hypothetical protein
MSQTIIALEQAVLAASNDLVRSFQREPYNFLYESDLQSELFSRLRSRIDAQIEIPRSAVPAEKPYRVHPVCTEYPTPAGRIDVVCLDPDRTPDSGRRRHKSFDVYVYELPILVAVELKYLKMGDVWNLFGACEEDRLKLRRLKDDPDPARAIGHGLVLGFVQNLATAGPEFARAMKQLGPELALRREVDDLDAVYFVTDDALFTRTTRSEYAGA